jgi:hypothetical protein
MVVLAVLFVFGISSYAQMDGGMMGEQKGEMKQQDMIAKEGVINLAIG